MFFSKVPMIFGKYGHGGIGQRILRRNYKSRPEYKSLLEEFNLTYPKIKKHILSKIDYESGAKDLSEVMDYHLDAGRQVRAAILLKTHELMKPKIGLPSDDNAEDLKREHVMAWITEMMQIWQLVLDDSVDGSPLRRNKVPWHVGRDDKIKMHLMMLLEIPAHLLNDYFAKDEFFHSALSLILKHNFTGPLSQFSHIQLGEWIRSKKLTWNEYRRSAIYKSNYCLEFPLKLGAFVATNKDLKFTPLVDEILEDISVFFQLINDATTVVPEYKHKKLIGKDVDEDIKLKKVDYAMVYFMENATEEDKDLIVSLMGRDDQECIKKVRGLYEKYDIINKVIQKLKDHEKYLRDRINTISNEIKLRDALHAAADVIAIYPHCSTLLKCKWE